MLKRTATALILTLGLAGLTQTAVQASDKADDQVNQRITRLEQQLERIEQMLKAAPQPLRPVQVVAQPIAAAPDSAQAAANALRQIAFFTGDAKPTGDDVKSGSIPGLGLDYYIKEYLEEKRKAEDKRVLGCVLRDILNCAKGCDDDECEKPAATTEPASWIYYSAPSKKNCVLKQAFGF